MKLCKKIMILCTILLIIVCPLNGCIVADSETTPKEDAEKSALAARVAELEATLQTEREENYIAKSALEEKIKSLEERLSLLTNGKETDKSEGNTMIFHYKVENGLASITKYEGNATLVEIPSTLDGYTVTRIGERAFEGNTHVAAVIVPSTVVAVDWFAFYGCSSLFDVTFPASVTTIGHAVFDGCAKPTITCPKGSYAAEYAKSYGIAYIEK